MDWVHAAMRDAMRRHAPALPSSHPAEHSLIGTPSGQRDVRKAGAAGGRAGKPDAPHRAAARGRRIGQGISQLSNRRLVWRCTSHMAHMDTQGHLSRAVHVRCRWGAMVSCRVMRIMAALRLQLGSTSLGTCAQCPGWAGLLLSCGVRVGRMSARHCIGEWSGGPGEDGCGRVCHGGGQTEERWDPVGWGFRICANLGSGCHMARRGLGAGGKIGRAHV